MKRSGTVSIVIPTYNCARYIGESVSSAIRQTYENVEVLVVDDGSTDNTAEVLRPYFNKIRFIRQKNHGVSQARNTAIDMSSGEYIAFIDADDLWLPNKLEIQISFLERNKDVAGVCTDFSTINSTGDVIMPRSIKKHYPIFKRYKLAMEKIFSYHEQLSVHSGLTKQNSEFDVYYGNIFKALFRGNFIKTSSFVVRKKDMLRIGGFNKNFHTQEDYEYWLRLAKEYELGYIDAPLTAWRKHDVQITRSDQTEDVILQSLAAIQNIAIEARKILGEKAVNQRLSEKYRSLGLIYLRNDKIRHAREALKNCIWHDPVDIKNFFFYLWSFVPRKCAEVIKYMAKKILIPQKTLII